MGVDICTDFPKALFKPHSCSHLEARSLLTALSTKHALWGFESPETIRFPIRVFPVHFQADPKDHSDIGETNKQGDYKLNKQLGSYFKLLSSYPYANHHCTCSIHSSRNWRGLRAGIYNYHRGLVIELRPEAVITTSSSPMKSFMIDFFSRQASS